MMVRKCVLLLPVGCVVILALVYCGGISDRAFDSMFIEPCARIDGSQVDPCARDPHWRFQGAVSTSYGSSSIPELPIDVYSQMKYTHDLFGVGLGTTQFYVRGTFVPGSARCSRTNIIMHAAEPSNNPIPARPLISGPAAQTGRSHFNCFVDLRVAEYFNGHGPGTIPIVVYWITVGDNPHEGYHQALLRGWPANQYEGKEMIVALKRGPNISVAAWTLNREAGWDVQRRSDGKVVVVSNWAGILGVADPSEWEYTLEEFRPIVKDAVARFRMYAGIRVGDDHSDPEFAKDASGASYIEHVRDLGAFTVNDVTPVPAPTVPGETDPDPYGYNVIEDSMAVSPEIPGGLEGTATPVSVLGDEPTATATADPTATPEAAPTPELQDTPTTQPAAKVGSEHSHEPARVDDGSGAVRVHSATEYPNAAGCRSNHGNLPDCFSATRKRGVR